ncbi:MAG: hydroxymethylpyrimidine/phosphomethylpyrimidine kinase [Deltaproteobacteria bacterium]|nr:hydroxymethylpyrimidine/phosphomethylpyrimidine kinase [Deltaproteobacteria bacterium]
MHGRPVVLTVGGLDPTSGAGIAADLATLALTGCRGRAVAAALTAQGDGPVEVHPVDPDFLARQLERACSGVDVAALKCGALGSAPQVEVVARFAAGNAPVPLIVDPVIRATRGGALLDEAGVDALRRLLVPRASVVTPNIEEAELLTGLADDGEAARALVEAGARWALVTGGHRSGEPFDLLAGPDGAAHRIEGRRIPVASTHGTGCVLASAVASGLALGLDVPEACLRAKRFVERALLRSPAGGPAPDLVGMVGEEPD